MACSTDPTLFCIPNPGGTCLTTQSCTLGGWTEASPIVSSAKAFKAPKICSNDNTVSCIDNTNCPTGGTCNPATDLVATSGDCNDLDPTIHPGATNQPYEVVFVDANNSPAGYFAWLPTVNGQFSGTAAVRRISDGTIITPDSVTITYTPDTTTQSPDITYLPGTYANDPAAKTDNTGPNGGPAPDYTNIIVNGAYVSLTSQDFGGSITFFVL
jgi:hypothetical protein